MEIKEYGHIYRQFNDVNFYNHKLIENNENEHLLTVSCNRDQFFLNLNSYQIDENENICSQNSPWFCLKKSTVDKKSNYFKICEGDVIKLGKIIIRVRRIKFGQKISNNKNNNITKNIDLYCSVPTDKIKNLKEINTNCIHDNKGDIIINNDLNNNNKENDILSLNFKNVNEETKKKKRIIKVQKYVEYASKKKKMKIIHLFILVYVRAL